MADKGFMDQKRRVATEDDCKRRWRGTPNGADFRCYLCGHKFVPGDGYRWVYSAGAGYTSEAGKNYGVINPMTCDACDGPDILDRWVEINKEFFTQPRFWALR